MITTDDSIIFEARKKLNSAQWTIWWCFNLAEKEIVDEEILNYIQSNCGFSYKETWTELFKTKSKSNYLRKDKNGKYHFYMEEYAPFVPEFIQLREEFYKTISQENPEWNNLRCIYGIYANDVCLYVGQTINLLQRAIQHNSEIWSYYKSNQTKYQILGELKSRGFEIKIKPIEKVSDEQNLTTEENKYIKEIKPILNSRVPDDNNKMTTINLRNLSIDDVVWYIEERGG